MKVFTSALVSVVMFVAVTGSASAAGTLAGSTSHGSVSVTVNDISFDGPDCVESPIQMTYTKSQGDPDNIALEAEVELTQAGSNSPSTGRVYVDSGQAASGNARGSVFVCPSTFNPANGPITVAGTFKSTYYASDSTQTVKLSPPATVIVNKNATTMSLPSVSKGVPFQPKARNLKGKITATTSRGEIGAAGDIQIAVKTPGSKKWVGGGSAYLDSFGNWSTMVPEAPKGTFVRVTLVNCGWCADAQRIVRISK